MDEDPYADVRAKLTHMSRRSRSIAETGVTDALLDEWSLIRDALAWLETQPS